MSIFFVLGPSEWRDAKKAGRLGFTPLEKRRDMVRILHASGHDAFLMRDVADLPGEGLAEKFLRILREAAPTHCILYWPEGATIDTAEDELVILRTLVAQGVSVPEIWILAQDITVQEVRGEIHVHDTSGRSAYLRDLMRRTPCLLGNWCHHDDLDEQLQGNAEAL